MFFEGNVELLLDEKGRFRIPAKYKSEFGAEKPKMIKFVSGCLAIFPESALRELFLGMGGVNFSNDNDLLAKRLLFSSTVTIESNDPQGRFVLPQDLKDFAGIDKQIIFVGSVDHLELWAKEKWDKYINGAIYDVELKKIKQRDTRDEI